MEQSRIELRFDGAIAGSQVTASGVVGGRVLGAVIDPQGPTIVQTILAGRVARQVGAMATSEAIPGTVTLRLNVEIVAHKKTLGKLSRLWVEPEDGRLTDLLFEKSSLVGGKHEFVVRADQVANFGEKQITLNVAPNEAAHFPIFRDDASLALDVGEVLETTLLDPRARRAVHARIEDGHVDLSGLLEKIDEQDALLAAIRRVPGVRGVRSDMIVTEELANQAASAITALIEKGDLGADPDIEVLSEHRIIYLNGTVGTNKAKTAAERAALNISGSLIVVNNLTVRESTTERRADPASPQTHNR